MASLPANGSLRDLGRIIRGAVAFGNFSPLASPSVGGSGGGGVGRPDFEGDAAALFQLLRERGVRCLLVGGIALLRYVKGRNTDDVDLILAESDLGLVPEIVVTDRNADFAGARFASLRIDLLLTTNPVFDMVRREHSTAHQFAEMPVPCATASGLVLLKLYALPSLYRQRDLARAALYENDILMLMQGGGIDASGLLAVLEPFLDAGAMGELTKIVAEINARLERMRQS